MSPNNTSTADREIPTTQIWSYFAMENMEPKPTTELPKNGITMVSPNSCAPVTLPLPCGGPRAWGLTDDDLATTTII